MFSTPDTLRTAALDSQKQAFAFAQRVADFQLGQMKVVESQLKAQLDVSRQFVESAVELSKANQKAWIDSFTPAKA